MTSNLDLIRGRQVVQSLTNQSGGAIVAGDVVIVSTANDESFTTTTSAAYNSTRVGVALDSIAAAASGRILLEGYAPLVNVSASATRGHYLLTHTVAKQATSQAGYAAGAFGQIIKAGTTPSAVIFPVAQVGSAGVTRSGLTTDNHLAVWNGSNADSIKDGGAVGGSGIPVTGWISDANTWTYSSADDPTGIISVNADMTGIIGVGMRIKLTQTTVKYFIVTAVGNFGGGATLVTVYGGTDYTLANAAITSPNYSPVKSPLGFPLSPAKWTQEYNLNTLQSQATPTLNVWYNIGTALLAIPIGVWNVHYGVTPYTSDASAAAWSAEVTLSTANNSESDADWTSLVFGTSVLEHAVTVYRTKVIALAAKTTYYLNTRTIHNGLDNLYNGGNFSPTIIRAVCAYL